ASEIDIRVLGTAFNVRSYPEEKDIVTTLVRGSLELRVNKGRGHKVYKLKPNEKLIVKKIPRDDSGSRDGKWPEEVFKQIVKTETDSIPAEAQWIQNRLVFIETPLSEIAKILSRWYGVTVTIEGDEAFKKLRFTGFYDEQTI